MKSRLKTWLVRGGIGVLGLILLAVLVGGGWWITRPPHPGPPELQEEQLALPAYRSAADSARALIEGAARELGLPSVSAAVSVGGRVVWAAAWGWADVSERRPAAAGTRYRAGSVSKAMTGLAAAELVEAGLLDLDAPVSAYLPDIPRKRWEVTPRQLGAHTGGIRHYHDPGDGDFFAEQYSKRHYGSVTEALQIFTDDPLLFEPGTRFRYSTHGFTLLSAVLEAAADTPFLDLMAARVWQPLGMTGTRPDDYTVEDPDRAVPYSALRGRLVHTEGADPSYKWAGGGILTTPSDLVRMAGGLAAGRVVPDTLRTRLFTARPLADGSPNPQGYALGWRNGRYSDLLGSPDSIPVLHHGGSSPGGSSFVVVVPGDTVAAAAMTNLSVAAPQPLRRAVIRAAGLFARHPPDNP